MRKSFYFTLALLFCTLLNAQNIDQSVVVNNDYLVQFSDFQRENIKPTLADSLYKFDYNFDYSVFDSPYKGAFDFSPYLVNIVPGAIPFEGKNLYLRAGAGVSLYPVLDFGYVPVSRPKFKLIITNNGYGHYGVFSASPEDRGNYDSAVGYYFYNNFNAKALVDFNESKFEVNLLYENRFAKTSTSFTKLHSGKAEAILGSNPKSKIDYNLKTSYRFANTLTPTKSGTKGAFSAEAYVNPLKIGVHRIALNAFFKTNGPSYIVAVTPTYQIKNGNYSLSLGARYDYSYLPPSTTQSSLSPVVDFRLVVLKDKLNIFGVISGGQGLYASASTLLNCPLYEDLPPAFYYKEIIAAKAGFNGQIQKFDYKLEAGYSMTNQLPMETLRSMVFQDIHLFYGEAELGWKGKRFMFDSKFRFNHFKLRSTRSDAYTPARFVASFDAKYNWLNRIYTGVSLLGSSSRQNISGKYSAVPGYIDLGLNFEYKYSKKWAFWLDSGNLLGMSIEKIPGIIEKSPYFTLGLTLVL